MVFQYLLYCYHFLNTQTKKKYSQILISFCLFVTTMRHPFLEFTLWIWTVAFSHCPYSCKFTVLVPHETIQFLYIENNKQQIFLKKRSYYGITDYFNCSVCVHNQSFWWLSLFHLNLFSCSRCFHVHLHNICEMRE